MASAAVVAKRYARALLEMSTKSADASKWLQPLTTFAESVKTSAELQRLLASPGFSNAEKWKIVAELSKTAGSPPELEKFLKVVVDADRIGAIVEISDTFRHMLFDAQNTVEAEVQSASEMTAAQKAKIQEMLEKSLNKKVLVTVNIDPTLLAGFRVNVAGLTMDASLKANIESIHKNLLRADFARKGVRAEA